MDHSADKQNLPVLLQESLEVEGHGLFTALKQALEKVMGLAAQKGVYREDIQHVLLVGGTSLIPSIQQTLDGYFRAITQRQRKAITQMPAWPATSWSVENTSIHVEKPFTAVVEGALQVSAGFQLADGLAHGYGLRYLDASGVHRFDEIIPMGSAYPTRKPVSVTLGTSRPDQDVVELVIGQIDSDALAAAEVNFAGGQAAVVAQSGVSTPKIVLLNAEQPLQVHLAPPGQPGYERLRVDFSLDSRRRLQVSVVDLKTRRILISDSKRTSPTGSQSAPQTSAWRLPSSSKACSQS
jgi:molecular chaperone DnaK (HSP70)